MKIIVPVSGGKDSQLCLALALEQFDPKEIRAVHQSTGYDHPLTYEHLNWMESFYGIKIEYTQSDNTLTCLILLKSCNIFQIMWPEHAQVN